MPRHMYNLIFWGIVIAQFGFPVAGISVLCVAGFGMVSYACWILSRHISAFRLASIAAGFTAFEMLVQGILPEGPAFTGVLQVLGMVVSGVFGWQLLTAISIDAQNMWHLDLASRARMARFLYLVALIAPAVYMRLHPEPLTGSPYLTLVPLLISLAGAVILLWTIQSAKVRLAKR